MSRALAHFPLHALIRGPVLLIVFAILAVSSPADDNDRERVQSLGGVTRLRLSVGEQRAIGIAIESARTVEGVKRVHTLGRVITVTELAEIRSALTNKEAELHALGRLIAGGAVARAKLESLREQGVLVAIEQIAVADRERLRLNAERERIRAEQEITRARVLDGWGPSIARLMNEESGVFDALLQHRAYLIQFALPRGKTLPAGLDEVSIAATPDPAAASAARVIGPAANAEPGYGATFFAVSRRRDLRAGMRLDVWYDDGISRPGVEVPRQSVIWYGGHRWVYVKINEEEFERRAIEAQAQTADTLLVESGVANDEPVVVVGAQTLLAEEFRWSIPDEDDD